MVANLKKKRSSVLANGQEPKEHYSGIRSGYSRHATQQYVSAPRVGSDPRRVVSDHTRPGGVKKHKGVSSDHRRIVSDHTRPEGGGRKHSKLGSNRMRVIYSGGGGDHRRVVSDHTRPGRGAREYVDHKRVSSYPTRSGGAKEIAAVGSDHRRVSSDHTRSGGAKITTVGSDQKRAASEHTRPRSSSNPRRPSAHSKQSRRRNSWNGLYDSKGRPRSQSSFSSRSPSHERTDKSLRQIKSNFNLSYSKSSKKSHPSVSSKDRSNNTVRTKFGNFRPYFVPIKKKRELLGPTSHHNGTRAMIEGNESGNNLALILQEGMKNVSVAPFLHEGIPVVKVSHNKPGKCHRRFLTLSEDQTTLFVTHSKLPKGARHIVPKQPTWTISKRWKGTHIRSIDIANICYFQVGAVTSRCLELTITKHSKTSKTTKENKSKEKGGNDDSAPFVLEQDRVATAVTIFHIDSTTRRMVSLDFFIENKDHRRAVVAALDLMTKTYAEASELVGNEILLLRYVLKDMEFGTNGEGVLAMNEKEFSTLCHRLNFTSENIGKEFREFCKNQTDQYDESFRGKNRNKLTFHQCLQLLQLLKGKDNPSLEAWRACFGNVTCVNAVTVLEKFLHGPQQEQKACDKQDARDLINIMNATELGEVISNRKGSLLSQWQFEEFLRSEWNDIYDPAKRVIDRQRLLTEPLSHYWINSSFNTASMIDGTHSVESYIRSLLRGCKSIDLKCWDGTILPDGEHVPIIYPRNECIGSCQMQHKLAFRNIVLVVRKYLDKNRNSYPIMLNLENNCTKPFQQSMAKIVKEVFGRLLFVPNSTDRRKELPSPEDLRGMIVINERRLPAPKMAKIVLESSPTSEYAYAQFDPTKVLHNKLVTFVSDSDQSDIRSEQELLQLTLFHDADFTGHFLESMELICSHMHDIKDTKVLNIVSKYADNAVLWRKFNESHLSRIYPNEKDRAFPHSLESDSNYSPVVAWAMGCQMASLNFQTHDTDLAINDGLFRQTGGIGYVPKPLWLLGLGERPPPIKLKIRVLSGNCIPKLSLGENDIPNDDSCIDSPCVVLELHDVVVDPDHGEHVKTSKHKVPCKNGNGFCPIFEDPGMKFLVETPDVASIVFRVEQNTKQGKILAQTAVPVHCMRRGYRSVQLHDMDNTRRGRFASATLLVCLV